MQLLKKILRWTNKKKEYFISLSYKDEQLFQETCNVLPNWITPFIFPTKKVTPNDMVSNDLIMSINHLDGLIYLKSKNSSNSIWVALERDYALRLNKKVFYFDPTAGIFKRDKSKHLNLKIFPAYSWEDGLVVEKILTVLSKERNFKVFLKTQLHPGVDFSEAISKEITTTIDSGGYAVLFNSQNTYKNKWTERELSEVLERYPKRILICNIDDSPLPKKFSNISVVKLYDPACQDNINKNLLDHLIVSLYWLIYQNTHPHLND